MYKWIDKRSVLHTSKRKYRAGDIIPADVLTTDRANQLIGLKKVAKIETEKTEKVEKVEVKEKPKRKKAAPIPEPEIEKAEVIDESLDGEDNLFE